MLNVPDVYIAGSSLKPVIVNRKASHDQVVYMICVEATTKLIQVFPKIFHELALPLEDNAAGFSDVCVFFL